MGKQCIINSSGEETLINNFLIFLEVMKFNVQIVFFLNVDSINSCKKAYRLQ